MADTRKSVLITGCSPGGIGHALALSFHRRNLRVFATARKAETIANLAERGIETLSLVVDDVKSVEICYKEVERRVGARGLDYLVNNAGRNYTFPALDVDIEEVKLTFATNLFSVIHINATFAPLVLRAKGTYVSIGSVAGEHPYVYSSVYNASKAALHAYANTLRIEVAPLGISVITVVTGGVRSNIARTERSLPPGSLYAPINTSFQRRVQQSQELGIATNIYTEQVVSRILGAKGWLWDTQEVWAGTAAHLFWWARWVDRVLPMGIWAPIYEWVFELGKLRGKAGLQKKAD